MPDPRHKPWWGDEHLRSDVAKLRQAYIKGHVTHKEYIFRLKLLRLAGRAD